MTTAEAKSTEDYIADSSGGNAGEQVFEQEAGAQEQSQEFEDIPVADNAGSESVPVDWQDEAKKWQSMYDKSQADKNKLEGAVQQYVKSTESAGARNAQANSQPALTEEEFNPWDAYYKPESKSYKFRAEQENNRINQAVGTQMQQLQEQVVVQNTVSELKNTHNMNPNEIREFLGFVQQPKEAVPLESLVKLWRDNGGIHTNAAPQTSTEVARSVQTSAPRSAGVLQGQPAAQPKNEKDKMWDAIVSAGGRSNVL